MLTVKIITATPLPATAETKIKKEIRKKYGSKVEYRQIINQNVVGGIKLIVGSREIDATIQGKLKLIKDQLEERFAEKALP